MNPPDTFTHDGRIYSLSLVRRLVLPQKMFLLPLKDLVWVLKYDTPDEDRIKLAQHRHPLLVSRWNGKWTVVDGLHRLEKYRRKGVKLIPVKEVTKEMLKRALVTMK